MKKTIILLLLILLNCKVSLSQNQYLYFISNDTTCSISINNDYKKEINLEFSYDTITWQEVISKQSIEFQHFGDTIFFRGENPQGLSNKEKFVNFSIEGKVFCSGNIMSLLDKSGNLSKIPNEYCFYKLFTNCKGLLTIPRLTAINLKKGCYQSMFYNCTSLCYVTDLMCVTLAPHCYESMFENCSSLEKPPQIMAENLSDHCCQSMFKNCVSMTCAPNLKSQILSNRCYRNMFYGCVKLTKIAKNSAIKLAEYCYENMYYGCPIKKLPKVYQMQNYINEDFIINIFGNCKESGYGAYIQNDKMLLGDFEDGVLVGQGASMDSDGNFYIGDFADNQQNGLITMLSKSGKASKAVFDKGEMLDYSLSKGCVSGNCMDGFGVRIFDDGRHYCGTFRNSMYYGYGTLQSPSSYYKGDFSEGVYDGFGTLVCQNGDSFTGHFSEGKFVSQSKIEDKYLKFNNFKQQENDSLTYLSTELGEYLGETKNGLPNGKGVLKCKNGYVIVSNGFINGNLIGYGIAENRQEGKCYIGSLINNSITGKGLMVYDDGTFDNGYFADGELLRRDESNSAKPKISISSKDLFSSESYHKSLNVIVTFYSETYLNEFIIKQNGTPIIVSTMNFLGNLNDENIYNFEYNITLCEGENVFTIEARNEAGLTISEPFTVNYSEKY